jgi:hypothetical protein
MSEFGLAQRAASQAVICPSGSFAIWLFWLSSPLAKNISLSPSGKSNLRLATSRLDTRGVRVVTNVGCGMRWTRRRRKTSGAGADGEVVWFWRPDAGVKFREAIREATVATKPGHREEHEGNR